MLRDPTVTKRENSPRPLRLGMWYPPLAPKMPNVNVLAVLLGAHLLGHAAPSRGNMGGAQHLRKQGARFLR